MAIKKLIWRDEELAAINTPAGSDHTPRYNITDNQGNITARAATINLTNEIRTPGTLHNAANMNKLLQKSDAIGSFYHRPMQGLPLFNFPQSVSTSLWHSLPPCPVSMGQNPVCVFFGGKYYITMGKTGQTLNHDIMVYDMQKQEWQVHETGRTKDVTLGGVQDFRIIDNRLFICGKDWNNSTAARGWLDILDLNTLSWTFGTTAVWHSNFQTTGPMCVSTNAQHAIIAGRNGTLTNGGNSMDRITVTSTAPAAAGLIPAVNGSHAYVPADISMFEGHHVLTTPNGQMFRATNLSTWQVVLQPGVAAGAMRHVKGVGGFSAFTDGGASTNIYRLNRDFTVNTFNAGRILNESFMAISGNLCYFMRSADDNGWAASAQWGVFDATTGNFSRMADAPLVFDGFGLCATQERMFAAAGHAAYAGSFEQVAQGVVLGRVFKGMSVSASEDVVLTNGTNAKIAVKGAWHEADDDYLICAMSDAEVFGQIANI